MIEKHPRMIREIFQKDYNTLIEALNSDKQELMAFVRYIQHPVQHYLYEHWRGMSGLWQNRNFRFRPNMRATSSTNLCLETFGSLAILMFDIMSRMKHQQSG
jgi:hypothetical protein